MFFFLLVFGLALYLLRISLLILVLLLACYVFGFGFICFVRLFCILDCFVLDYLYCVFVSCLYYFCGILVVTVLVCVSLCS